MEFHLINQILDLSKIEHNKLQIVYQQGDILHYLRYITESFYSAANANNVLLKLESNATEIWMDYDPEKIRQIISNLLSNAIKFTPSGGRVLLRVKEATEQLQIEVLDTGKGIAAEYLPHIFDRYYQVEEDVAQTGGTGIGLALTRELVSLLDGSIKVDSTLNEGTIFTILLPLRREAALQKVLPSFPMRTKKLETEKNASRQHLPTLLIVEDNLDVAEYLTLCLQAHYELSFAYNGQAGIEKALELTPDLIVADVMMPEKTGLELTDLLKTDERTSHIPILLLTAKADFESRLAGLKQGADVYLTKPFHQEELLVHLKNLLTLRQNLHTKYQKIALSSSKAYTFEQNDQEQIFLDKLRQYLMDELDNADLKASDAAKAIGMSRSNLYSKLSAITGMSFNIYLRTLRLNSAKELLLNSSLNISEIAYQVGFNDPAYFSKKFTQQFGESASSMKNKQH